MINFYKKSLLNFFFFYVLFSFNFLNSNSPIHDLNIFTKTLKRAEFIYLHKAQTSFDLDDKLDILEQMYKYRDICKKYLNENNYFAENDDFYKVEYVFYPLVKEVIKRLEIHVEMVHGYLRSGPWKRIVKPLCYMACFESAGLITSWLSGVLSSENVNFISKESCNKIGTWNRRIMIGGGGATFLWIMYNYRNDIRRKFRRANNKIKNFDETVLDNEQKLDNEQNKEEKVVSEKSTENNYAAKQDFLNSTTKDNICINNINTEGKYSFIIDKDKSEDFNLKNKKEVNDQEVLEILK